MVSTYPPTACGLATFAHALIGGVSGLGVQVDVVEPLRTGAGRAATAAMAAELDRHDVVLVQHEYGIYGGVDGQDVVDLLAAVNAPTVTVLHTVLAAPSPHQRQVLRAVIANSHVVVTMTRTARQRAIDLYGAHPDHVVVIPHGAADALVRGSATAGHPAAGARPVILTWGLLGVGKGIEWGIEAMAHLRDLVPRPVYLVAGRTHPKVREHEGERYREMLEARAVDLGVADDVVFDSRYLDAVQLHRLVRSADAVLLPYDSREQVTSGVLIEAIAAGRPVVSSRFPHAVELLGGGAGLLVEQRDPLAIAAALRRILTEPQLATQLSREADALAPDLSWLSVAGRYIAVAEQLSHRTIDLDAVAAGSAGRSPAGLSSSGMSSSGTSSGASAAVA
jgi:glycosyltransferase involved in cell wall biosynthesis